jgi:cytochrome c553
MPDHIVRLVLLLVLLTGAAYGAKRLFTVASFYEYGHYRGASVADIASDKPKYQGTAYCQPCHTKVFAEWSRSIHNSPKIAKVIKCEVCHGPAGGRDNLGMFVHAATGPEHPKNLKLAIPSDSRRLCTLCHEQIVGRPAQQRQIVVADHAGTQQCTTCHNPHSPKIALASVATVAGDAAAGKAKAAACAGCHGLGGAGAGLPGPSLAGQRAAYLIAAFKAYATGGRDNPMMSAVAQGVGNGDVADIAAYFAGLKCDSTLTPDKQAAAAGRAAADKCVACHGADGKSSNAAFPNLIGKSKPYLAVAVTAYRGDTRKNPMMAGIAKALSDAEIDSVAGYYAGASCR